MPCANGLKGAGLREYTPHMAAAAARAGRAGTLCAGGVRAASARCYVVIYDTRRIYGEAGGSQRHVATYDDTDAAALCRQVTPLSLAEPSLRAAQR